MKGFSHKFTVVTAVYNVEDYLRESVDSVLNQTIGFEDNVQLILVDDGSTDGSGEICDEYAASYPNNIIALHKDNGGVASARNLGVSYATGRYVNFLDPDDYLSTNTLETVYEFFSQVDDQVDVVSIPLVFFEGRTGDHQLNYKFQQGTRVIDLEQEYQNIQMSVATAFIKLDAIRSVSFDESLVSASDSKASLYLLIKKRKLGVVVGCQYHYRVRSQITSIVQSAASEKKYFAHSLKQISLDIYAHCLAELGRIPRFIQYCVMYDIQWKVQRSELTEGLLSDEEVAEFYDCLKKVLEQTDDSIIIEQKHIYTEHKNHLLELKYGRRGDIEATDQGIALMFGDTKVCFLNKIHLRIDSVDIVQNTLRIEGFYVVFGPIDEIEVFIHSGDTTYATQIIPREKTIQSLGKLISKNIGFLGEIPLEKGMATRELHFSIRLDPSHVIDTAQLKFVDFPPESPNLPKYQWYKRGHLVTVSKFSLTVRWRGAVRNLAASLRYRLRSLKAR